MDRAELRRFIESSEWFDGVPAEVLDTLAGAATVQQFAAGSFVWTAGEQTTHLYGVLSGRVRISLAGATGQEFALIDWEQGAWLGEQTLGLEEPNMLEVRAMVHSELLVLPARVLLEVGNTWPTLYRNLYRSGWTNTRGLYEILSAVLFYPLRARVAGRVLALMQEHGQRQEDGVLIDIKLSQNDFARLAMGSRQRVNRIFRDWDQRGLVATRNDHLLIRDIEGLQGEMEPFE